MEYNRSESLFGEKEVTTTKHYKQNGIHLHQLVIDTDGLEYCVTGLNDETAELSEVHKPFESNAVGFGKTFIVTYDELFSVAEPQTATHGGPVYAY